VPFLFFFSGTHEDYHQLGDHSDKLAYDRMVKIARTSFHIVDPIANAQATPTFIHHVGWLGVEIRDGAFAAIEAGTKVSLEVKRGEESVVVEVERAKTGYLGIYPGQLEEEKRKELGLHGDSGVFVRQVGEDGPAAASGLKAGDVILQIGGNTVGAMTLGKVLQRIGAGEKVACLIIRDAERLTIELVLGERPQR
jgi:C-terminal processing protease CtpA/Prc